MLALLRSELPLMVPSSPLRFEKPLSKITQKFLKKLRKIEVREIVGILIKCYYVNLQHPGYDFGKLVILCCDGEWI